VEKEYRAIKARIKEERLTERKRKRLRRIIARDSRILESI